VQFDNADAPGVRLAGTLTMPPGDGPFTAAILLTGSGPQNRNEEIFGHQPFAVLADYLTRNSIAVLRYDDRGVAQSTGQFVGATPADFASDARAAVAFLARQNHINRRAIGLVGHSEGGITAPLAALDNADVAYLVLLAAPGTDLAEVLLSQRRLMGVMQGIGEAKLLRTEPLVAHMYQQVANAVDLSGARRRVDNLLDPEAIATLNFAGIPREVLIDQFANNWLRALLRYDVAKTLKKIQVPILALNGSLDRQVSAAENLAALKRATSRNRDASIRLMPGLNHLFQTARTGALGEYDQIDETFAPAAMQMIATWINAQKFAAPVGTN
jgi:uncharacterized protein